jgi:Zn-dependent peptidase ImmA (M78 family)
MKIPRKVDVLGESLKIAQSDRIEEAAGEDTLGIADLLEGKIYIHSNMPQGGKEYILYHEIWHHALWLTGLDQTMTKEQVESSCQTFATVHRQLKRQGI